MPRKSTPWNRTAGGRGGGKGRRRGAAPGPWRRRWPAGLEPVPAEGPLPPARRRGCRVLFAAGVRVTAPLGTSIYISGARCPMASGEPIRWQIRCQLGGSCLETVQPVYLHNSNSEPGGGDPAAPRSAPALQREPACRNAGSPQRTGKALRRGPPPRDHRAYLSTYRSIHPSIDRRSYGAGGARGCVWLRRPARCPRPFFRSQGLFLLFIIYFSSTLPPSPVHPSPSPPV